MKEKIFEKKLQALKELGVKYKWTFHVSEKGDYYIKNCTPSVELAKSNIPF